MYLKVMFLFGLYEFMDVIENVLICLIVYFWFVKNYMKKRKMVES